MVCDLNTIQGEKLSGVPWQVYPRPQMKRDSYVNLNGIWEFGVGQWGAPGVEYDREIRVPFCPESRLSGIGEHFPEGSALCYRRKVVLPQGFCQDRVLLYIGAADQELECYVNSKLVGVHFGGYEAMTFDITDALQEENILELRCRDDLSAFDYPYGKQSLRRGGMWYTPVSGIWQSAWLESVPEQYIEKLQIENRGGAVSITVTPTLEGKVTVSGVGEFPLVGGKAVIAPETPRLWSPEDPYLYEFAVETDSDRVESYFALRTIEAKQVDGIPRLCLNGKPYFFHGLLDQGYWPDGLFTPADPTCYAEDILAMKQLGFNTLRKHIKVEAEEFYYQCDRLGMVVFQDMVNNGDYRFLRDTALPTLGFQKLSDKRMHKDPSVRKHFLDGAEATVRQLQNHPCILYWTLFNEGWGQFDADSGYAFLRALDDTRIIDATSGWFRQKDTDVESLHIYFDLWHRLKKAEKPLVLSEFGGFCYGVKGHLFDPKKAYGYKACKTETDFQTALEELYRTRILPAIPKGLCAAIYTQISDVEEEINGILTYDRKVCKADPEKMRQLADQLQAAMG